MYELHVELEFLVSNQSSQNHIFKTCPRVPCKICQKKIQNFILQFLRKYLILDVTTSGFSFSSQIISIDDHMTKRTTFDSFDFTALWYPLDATYFNETLQNFIVSIGVLMYRF